MSLEASHLGKLTVEGLAVAAEVAGGGDNDQESLALLPKIHAGQLNGTPNQGFSFWPLLCMVALPPRVSEETKKSNGSNDDSEICDQIQTFHRTCLQMIHLRKIVFGTPLHPFRTLPSRDPRGEIFFTFPATTSTCKQLLPAMFYGLVAGVILRSPLTAPRQRITAREPLGASELQERYYR